MSAREQKPDHAYTFVPGMQSTTKKAKRVTLNDVVILLTSEPWAEVFHYDEFRRRVVAANPPTPLDAERDKLTDADLARVGAWLNYVGRQASRETIADGIVLAAKHNAFHPIREYLDACTFAEPFVLPTLASRVFGCEPGIADEFLTKTLIGAVRRIRHPGCRMDTTLTLVGKQGIRKSTFVSVIGGEDFTRSQMPDLGSKDASAALAGFWFVEIAELDRIVRAETSTVKEFLTRTNDDFRASYARLDERHPRQCVFIGTTNEGDFLRDATGNRRFWPIICEHVDIDFVRANRDQIWGEAAALEAAGVPHWFDAAEETRAEEAREPHVVEDPWHHLVAEYLAGRAWVRAEDVYLEAIAPDEPGAVARFSKREQMRVGDTLRRLGCVREQRGPRKGWRVPDAIASATPSALEASRRTDRATRRAHAELQAAVLANPPRDSQPS